MLNELSRDDLETIRSAVKPGDGWSGDEWELALCEEAIAFAGRAITESRATVEGGVDWLGLALDLEAQAKRVESRTVERAMKSAAHGLRLMGAAQQAQATSAESGLAVACVVNKHLGDGINARNSEIASLRARLAIAESRAAAAAPVVASGEPVDFLPPMNIRNDRDMLNYLMVAFDNEILCCDVCGHSAPTKDMDSAGFLRDYLKAAPASPAAPVAQPADERALFKAWLAKQHDGRSNESDDWEVWQARARLSATPAAPLAQQSEPVGEVANNPDDYGVIVDWKGQPPAIGTRLYASSAPASPVPKRWQDRMENGSYVVRLMNTAQGYTGDKATIMAMEAEISEWRSLAAPASPVPATVRRKFIDLPYGTRFRYVGGERDWVILSRGGCGTVAGYEPYDGAVLGQSICAFADSEEKCRTLEVDVVLATAPASTGPCSDDTAKDAARYRWLREDRTHTQEERNVPWCVALDPKEMIPTMVLRAGIDLDHAIDAALSAAEQGGKA